MILNMSTLLLSIHGDSVVVRFYNQIKKYYRSWRKHEDSGSVSYNSGMTPEQVAERMDVPMKFINACMR